MKRIVLLVTTVFFLTLITGGYFAYKTLRKPTAQPTQQLAEDTTITLIEGWTTQDMGLYLEEKGLASSKDFITAAQSFQTLAYPTVNQKPASHSLEGYIFPDTYRIPKIPQSATSSKANSEAVLKKALQNFEIKFTGEMEQQARGRGMTVHEIMTLASIIEKEIGRNVTNTRQREALQQERRTIAGIFYNRLRIGMPLQSDATVNYVTGKNTPGASLEDIETDSPYNTYKYKGLPPGPIANPSLSSIEAALNPVATDYLYFLHKQPSGKVMYAKTFEEHVRNKTSP